MCIVEDMGSLGKSVPASHAVTRTVDQRVGGCLMPRRPARFIQADVARAIRAAKQSGADHVEVRPDGTIVVMLVADADKNQPDPLAVTKEIVL